jgi:hypothetical protein
LNGALVETTQPFSLQPKPNPRQLMTAANGFVVSTVQAFRLPMYQFSIGRTGYAVKRLIINLTVAAATFSLGAATSLLLNPNHQISVSGPPVTPPSASVPKKSATLSNYSTSPPDLVCDYDPGQFNPRGDYYILGPKPKHFREFDCLELAVDERASGVGLLQTYWHGTYGGPYIVSGSITKRRLAIVAVPISEEDFEYRFEGNFLREGVLSNAPQNETVLQGYLTKLKRGVKIAECEVRFRVEYLGC